MNILRIDSSIRDDESVGRDLATRLIDRLNPNGTATIVERDLRNGPSPLDESTVGAAFTPPDSRSEAQVAMLAEGQTLIDELKAADAVVIAIPIYNFSAPASLKAWVDLIIRPGETFQVTDSGLVGLVEDRPTYLVVTSGNVPIGSPLDWATGWMQQLLGFIGITDVTVIGAGELSVKPEAGVAAAREAVAELVSA